MMAQKDRMTQTDQVRHLIELIEVEKVKLQDALDAIQEYARMLSMAAGDAQQRLIGRQQ